MGVSVFSPKDAAIEIVNILSKHGVPVSAVDEIFTAVKQEIMMQPVQTERMAGIPLQTLLGYRQELLAEIDTQITQRQKSPNLYYEVQDSRPAI